MKKIFFLILSLLVFFNSFGKQYFIATNGDDSNNGSINSPFAGFDAAYAVAQPGDTIWVRGGTHTVSTIWAISKAGNVNAYYNLWGYAPDIEKGDSVILNVSASNGIRIQLGGQYWHIKGLVIQNSDDNGMRIEGSYNIIENCVFRYNSDSGLTIQQSNGTMPNDGTIASYNLILNCDSYFNDKNVSNADGFACKLSPGAGNVFRGCRSWANGDDGWDFYYSRFQIIVEDCWTFRNGVKGGNGNGFKSNGSASSSSTPRTQAPHVYIRCISFDHKYTSGSNNKGFDQNHNEGNVTLINCLSFDNEKNYAYQEDTQNGKNHTFRNCVGFEPYSESLGRTLLPGEVINPGTDNEISYDKSNTWFGNTIDAAYNSWNLVTSFNNDWNPSRDDYQCLSLTDALAEREKDGSLQKNGFGHLKPESKMKDAGISYSWELSKPVSSYPNNPTKPYYVKTTIVTTDDSMPDLGPYEIPSAINPNNQAPSVNIAQPASGSEFKVTDVISLQAEASDTDGTISRVEFYANNNLIGISYSSPYKYNWTCTTAGEYSVTAKAYDNNGASTISISIIINVKDNSGQQLGTKQLILKLTGTSLTDEIQNKVWNKANTTSFSNSHIKLSYSSSKGGTIISPSIDMKKYLPDSLMLTFASSGGGNRNLNIYVSSDGGNTYGNAFVQAGAANGVSVPVKMKLSDKISGEDNFVLKIEAANTIEVWNIQATGYDKTKSAINTLTFNNIKCSAAINSGKLMLKITLAQPMPLNIDIYNLQGIKMSHISNSNYKEGINIISVDLNNYHAGVYLVKINSGTDNLVSKIIFQ